MIDRSIGVHPQQREKMAIRPRRSRQSAAHRRLYEVVERFAGFAAVDAFAPRRAARIKSACIWPTSAVPLLCDRQYGGRARSRVARSATTRADTLVLLGRQALHARRLRFVHPATGQAMEVEAPLAGPEPAGCFGRVAGLSGGARVVRSTPVGNGLRAVPGARRVSASRNGTESVPYSAN